ncbi:achaete-scute homolog 5-like [Amia ocellicauda]|uniref:achaete-scute homolog 5-like n=1 Tax=Amia ocellicauda TaxID=2972642 RepID=UPI0034640BB2
MMNSSFSHALMERRPSMVPGSCVPYGIAPPSGHTHSDHLHHHHHHPHHHHRCHPGGGHGDTLAHMPFLLYPTNVDPGYYEASYSGALFPYMPFHGHFGLYDCPFEPAFIQKRNERERQRVKCVNEGYARLRDHLPGAVSEKRLSKVETLRAAIRYIKYLQEMVTRGPPGATEAEERVSKGPKSATLSPAEAGLNRDCNSDGESQNSSSSSASSSSSSSSSASPYCESEESLG